MSKMLPALLLLLAASAVQAQTLEFGQGWEIGGKGSNVGPYMTTWARAPSALEPATPFDGTSA